MPLPMIAMSVVIVAVLVEVDHERSSRVDSRTRSSASTKK